MEPRNFPTYTRIYILAAVAVLGALGAGVYLLHNPNAPVTSIAKGVGLLIAGYLGMVAILVTLPIALNLAAARRSSIRHQSEFMCTLTDRLEGISILMNLMSEQQLLSDRAKAVAFREKDHEALTRAVVEEIGQQNWQTAYLLANDIENQFGFKQEADAFRAEISQKRAEIQRRQMAEMLGPVDRHIKAEAWGTALQEAQQIMEAFPDDPQCQRLPEEIEARRQQRKQQLRESWQDSIDRHDVDGSIEILKKLDLYLTPAEAESMQEIARNVFKEKREALRVRFSQAVKEQRIPDAIRLGEEIMNDFPNTRMAQEVRDMMDTLRQRMLEPMDSSTWTYLMRRRLAPLDLMSEPPPPQRPKLISPGIGAYFGRYIAVIVKNVVGWVLILSALVLGSVFPVPIGTPLFLIGFAMISLPGKRRLTSGALRGKQVGLFSRNARLWRIAVALLIPPALLGLWALQRHPVLHPSQVSLGHLCALYAGAIVASWFAMLLALLALNAILRILPRVRRKVRPWLRGHGVNLLPPRRKLRFPLRPPDDQQIVDFTQMFRVKPRE